jgi:hypothetical protein
MHKVKWTQEIRRTLLVSRTFRSKSLHKVRRTSTMGYPIVYTGLKTTFCSWFKSTPTMLFSSLETIRKDILFVPVFSFNPSASSTGGGGREKTAVTFGSAKAVSISSTGQESRTIKPSALSLLRFLMVLDQGRTLNRPLLCGC